MLAARSTLIVLSGAEINTEGQFTLVKMDYCISFIVFRMISFSRKAPFTPQIKGAIKQLLKILIIVTAAQDMLNSFSTGSVSNRRRL